MRHIIIACGLFIINALSAKHDDFAHMDTSQPQDAIEFKEEAQLQNFLKDKDLGRLSEGGDEFSYQSETERLMNIIVNSLYTDRDVFLRELVSNAADASEKARVLQLRGDLELDIDDLGIYITLDTPNKRIIVSDMGIGMCKEELRTSLGTVAKSGTEDFLSAVKRGASDSHLIGQFGVGFYSAFLVAEKVVVKSKCANESHSNLWISHTGSSFKIVELNDDDEVKPGSHGTSVILQIKKDAEEYLTNQKINGIIERFSPYVTVPIYYKNIEDLVTEVSASLVDDIPSGQRELDARWVYINEHKPIWLKDRSNTTDKEYNEFYFSLIKRHSDKPLTQIHFKTEGDLEFTALLFVPSKRYKFRRRVTVDDEDDNFVQSNIRLFVQRVLISDTAFDFLPHWMNFIVGVIDSNDLPLKVDRETFTDSIVVQKIRQKVVSKIFEALKTMSRQADEEQMLYEQEVAAGNDTIDLSDQRFKHYRKYNDFWTTFGTDLMSGCIFEQGVKTKKRVLDSARVYSRKHKKEVISLQRYINEMKEGQKVIYYTSATDADSIDQSPALEFFVQNDIDVLIFTGVYDEACVREIEGGYHDYTLKSIDMDEHTSEDIAFLSSPKMEENEIKKTAKHLDMLQKALNKHFRPLTKWANSYLGSKLKNSAVSNRLVKYPAIVTAPKEGYTAATERVIRSHMAQDATAISDMMKLRVLEFNPRHPVIKELRRNVIDIKKTGDFQNDLAHKINKTLDVLFESGLMAAGYQPTNIQVLVEDLYQAIGTRLLNGLSDDERDDFNLDLPAESYPVDDEQESPSELDDGFDIDDLIDSDEEDEEELSRDSDEEERSRDSDEEELSRDSNEKDEL